MPSTPLHVVFVCPAGQTPPNWAEAAPQLGWQLIPVSPTELRECTGPAHDTAAVVYCEGTGCGEHNGRQPACKRTEYHCPSVEEVRAVTGDRPLIVIAEQADPLAVTHALLHGATLTLPARLEANELRRILQEAQTSPWLSPPFNIIGGEAGKDPLPQIVGRSQPMQRVKNLVRRWADLDRPGAIPLPVLLYGETGTGKGHAARTLHQLGSHRDGPFVTVSCRAQTTDGVERALFGNPRHDAHRGLAKLPTGGAIGRARGGILFIDEILALTPATQVKLVRFLEERAHLRMNEAHEPAMDFRLIATTNDDLPRAIATGRFRADLFHRVECLTLQMPPLRERSDDIVLLARHFLSEFATEHGTHPLSLSAGAVHALRNYSWPGNVRELKNALIRAAMRAHTHILRATDLGLTRPALSGETPDLSPPLPAAISRPQQIRITGNRRVSIDFTSIDQIDIEGLRRDLIRQAMEASRGNQSEAARRLGLSRNALRYAVKKYGIVGRT